MYLFIVVHYAVYIGGSHEIRGDQFTAKCHMNMY